MIAQLTGRVLLAPHAHAAESSKDAHSWQPHVHISGGVHHHHGHEHAPDSEHIHLDDDVRHGKGSSDFLGLVKPVHDHDSDAVYLASSVQASIRTAESIKGDIQGQSNACFGKAFLCGVASETPSTFEKARPFFSTTGQHCALYLSLRTLRI
jgi:hypothetical protein